MHINGIGRISRKEAVKFYDKDAQKKVLHDVKTGEISETELASSYKRLLVRNSTFVGRYGDTYNAICDNLPTELFDELTPAQLVMVIEAMYRSGQAGYESGLKAL